ncbi:MAG: Gfo/Idh/MocA family oxidoreductase [Lactimicrobium sp.]|jgi:predicted dehydrogenase|uniref:Gfo/Idh/MocA family protein n=1 Tax=Lactimicrobium sp. TaxID=2563780 RepID=UPI002F351AB8
MNTNTDHPIRWGIIGAGGIAKRFCASLASFPQCHLYAISGRNREKMEAFQKEFPCDVIYTDFDALIQDQNVDAVYIALPHFLHAQWAIRALQAHKPVFSEKPAVITTKEMKQVIQAARDNSTLYMEAMKTRFEPAYIALKKHLDEIGTITHVYAGNSSILPEEKFGKGYHTSGKGSGCLLDGGCYLTDIAIDLFEGLPEVKLEDLALREGVDMYVKAALQFPEGSAEIECGFDRIIPSHAIITGTKGTITFAPAHRPDHFTVKTAEAEKTYQVSYDKDDFHGEIAHFVQLLQEGKIESDVMSWDDSMRNMEVMEAIASCWKEQA